MNLEDRTTIVALAKAGHTDSDIAERRGWRVSTVPKWRRREAKRGSNGEAALVGALQRVGSGVSAGAEMEGRVFSNIRKPFDYAQDVLVGGVGVYPAWAIIGEPQGMPAGRVEGRPVDLEPGEFVPGLRAVVASLWALLYFVVMDTVCATGSL